MRALLLLVSMACTTFANPWQHDGDKVALSGYDVVSFFKMGPTQEPAKGKPEFQHTWNRTLWYFSSSENLKKFRSDPKRYVPLYLGYCAYAVSRNYIYSGDPLAWTIHKGSLYLNANKSVRDSWLREKEQNIVKADKNWPDLNP